MRKTANFIFIFLVLNATAQPNWEEIKSNVSFDVPDPSYGSPHMQSNAVPGWEDGLFMTRDGKQLFSTYLPVDAFSWLNDLVLDPVCFDFHPYYRPPLLGVDTITNIFGCEKYMHSDIIMTSRESVISDFDPWNSSNMQESFSFDGGVQGVLANEDSFDLFVFTRDGIETSSTDIFFMRDVSRNPTNETAVPLFVTEGQEDNPHIERLNDSALVILFDRDRYMYYALSNDNGESWEEEVLIPTVLNDQAPYDVQPHLWHDGVDWWVYYCADNEDGVRSIYRSKQMSPGNWGDWEEPELVLSPNVIIDDYGYVYGVGEPSLSEWGDLSFVVVYGNHELPDTTDVYDCDPWIMPKIDSPLSNLREVKENPLAVKIFPNPTEDWVRIELEGHFHAENEICIYNAQGQICKRILTTESSISFEVQDLDAGVYYIQIKGVPDKFRLMVR